MAKRHLVKAKLPRSSSAAFSEIRRILAMGWIDIPDQKSFRGTGAPGRLLEHLLGIKENNQDSPDLMDWEIKFHGGNALITLFHKDPEPRGIMRNLVHEHGWKDAQNRISFRHTLGGESDRGFYVVNESDRIVIRHKTKDTVVPFWLHNTLLNAAGAKLRRLILVEGEMQAHQKRVKYKKATAFWDFNLTNFGDSLEKGTILIDFDARTKGGAGTALRNHGTKFRVNLGNIASLYEHSQKITGVG